jgi:Rod binding domain-containing protein
MSNKKQLKEFTAVNKFVDKFFQGVINNTTDRFLSKAKSSGVNDEIINQMKKIQKETDELDAIIKKYSKK